MTAILLKDIAGALINQHTPCSHPSEYENGYEEGFNDSIVQQGQVSLTLDREKLAKVIFKRRWPDFKWDNLAEQRIGCLLDADAIISKQATLFKVAPP